MCLCGSGHSACLPNLVSTLLCTASVGCSRFLVLLDSIPQYCNSPARNHSYLFLTLHFNWHSAFILGAGGETGIAGRENNKARKCKGCDCTEQKL